MTLAAAGIAALGLAGCVGGDPLPTLPPSPSSTPLFSSEEEALAAAEEAYAAYLEMSNLISSEGGARPERIEPFVTEEYLPIELESARTLAESNLHVVGDSSVTRFELQRFNANGTRAEITAYVCLDVSAARVLDITGTDVTPAGRAPLLALEVRFVAQRAGDIRVDGSDLWPDSSFCL